MDTLDASRDRVIQPGIIEVACGTQAAVLDVAAAVCLEIDEEGLRLLEEEPLLVWL